MTAPVPSVPALDEATEAALRVAESRNYMVSRGVILHSDIQAILAAAYPIIAAQVEARTREATAREIVTAARRLYGESFRKPTDSPFEHGVRNGIDQVYTIAARIVNERLAAVPEGSAK